MAQKKNNAGNADISSRSFYEILERMRNRVSEISEGGEVDKVLSPDADKGNDGAGNGQVILSEEEQDRAFLQMSQKQSNSRTGQVEPSKDGQAGRGMQGKPVSDEVGSSLQPRREDQTSVLEMSDEDEQEARTYQEILAALEVKELSGLHNDKSSELDRIVSEERPATVVQEETKNTSAARDEGKKLPYEDDSNGSFGQDDAVRMQPEKAAVSEPEEKKSSQAFDRLAMVAGNLEKSLDEKVKNEKVQKGSEAVAGIEAVEIPTEAVGSVTAVKQPPAPAKPVNVEDEEPAVAIKPEPQKSQDAPVPVISKDDIVGEDRAGTGHEQRLDKIEDSLALLMAAQLKSEEKASGLLELQQDSFRKMTGEAQKVAEITASKIAVQSSAHVVLDTIKEHAVSRSDMATVQDELKQLNERLEKSDENSVTRSDMTTVQDELKEMNARFGKSVEKQADAYELMQSSLAKLHEKMSEIGTDKKMVSAAPILVDADFEKKVAGSPELIMSEEKESDIKAVEFGNAQQEEAKEETREVQEELVVVNESISAQVLRNFVNAPMVNHDIQSGDAGYGAVGSGDSIQGQSQESVRTTIGKDSQANVPMPGGQQEHTPARMNEYHTTEFSGQTHQQRFESLVKDKKKIVSDTRGKAKSSVLLAISSMLMFSVSGYLFYDHLKSQGSQGAPEMTASVSQPVNQKVATLEAGQGLVGEKKLVKWSYSGQGKPNTERLSANDKAANPVGKTQYTDVASHTEIIEVAGGSINDAPVVTSSLGRHEALDLTTGGEKVEKLVNGKFARPSVRIGSSSLRQASAKGVASAMFEVARRFQNGKGVKKDYKEAVKWYRRSADKGFAPAQYRLGTLYERGRGVPKQIEKARDWYRKAANGGNVKAMHNLGVIFSGQKQIKADYILATKWFSKAARYGLADSQFNLAIINYNGLGKSKDMKQAYKWFALAAKNGDKAAKEQKDNLARKMKIRQIMESRNMVSAWKTKKPSRKANIDLSQKYYWRDYAAL